MSAAPLTPNRIHSLPVRVTYHLQASSQTFSTLFPTPEQVYVHPTANGSQQIDGQHEAWGAIYLKTIIQGVLMASPELHPNHQATPDLSLYVLDPRETYLRRSRAAPAHNLRSSPSRNASSLSSTAAEVWTGKGLVSWALNEPGAGKHLITGRLVQSTDFAAAAPVPEGMSALEALMAANTNSNVGSGSEGWGIEVAVGLKSSIGDNSVGYPGPLHPSVEDGTVAGHRLQQHQHQQHHHHQLHPHHSHSQQTQHRPPPRLPPPPHLPPPYLAPPDLHPPHLPPLPQQHHHHDSSSIPSREHREPSFARADSRPLHRVTSTGVPRIHPPTPRQVAPPPPPRQAAPPPSQPVASSSKAASVPPPGPAELPKRPVAVGGRKRKQPMDSVDTNCSESLPPTAPAPVVPVVPKIDVMTKEKAQELLKDSAFLSVLEQLMGAPVAAALAAGKRVTTEEPPPKRSRYSQLSDEELKCSNCGTNKSSVWRTKKSDDGQSMRVCNACGLYYNKTRTMRPKTLWADSDEGGRRSAASKVLKGAAKASAAAKAAAMAAGAQNKTGIAGAPASSFKRSLTQVVEKDAARIANLRRRPPPRHIKPVPMTSPPRGPAADAKSVRNAKFATSTAVAASSPGGCVNNNSTPVSSGPATAGPSEMPNAALRRILDETMPSLAMPLSDDASSEAPNHSMWHTDLSSFFDVNTSFAGTLGDTVSVETPAVPDPAATTPNMTADAMANPPSSATRSKVDLRGVSSAVRPAPSKTDDDSMNRPAAAVGASSEDDVFSQLFARTSSVGDLSSASSPFDFSQLPPSSPPALPSGLSHSALLLSSPSSSPNDTISPRTESDFGKPSPATTAGQSGLRNEVAVEGDVKMAVDGEASPEALQELLTKLAGGNMSDELLALFNSFPAGSA